jgi:acetyl esterase/lipase
VRGRWGPAVHTLPVLLAVLAACGPAPPGPPAAAAPSPAPSALATAPPVGAPLATPSPSTPMPANPRPATRPPAAGTDGLRTWRAVPFTPRIPCGGATTCRLRMDVFAPAAPGPWPLVVLLPGGPKPPSAYGYVNGGARAIAAAGAVVMTAAWRMSDGYGGGWRSSFEDVACAVGVARATAAAYGADPAHVTLAAHSLGAWIAAVVALTPTDFAPPAGRCAATAGALRPDALVTLSGAVDQVRRQGLGRAYVEGFLHSTRATRPERWAAADPFALAAKHPPGVPVTVVGAGRDTVVAASRARAFSRALREAGHSSRLVVVPGAGHGSVLTAPATVRAVLAATASERPLRPRGGA